MKNQNNSRNGFTLVEIMIVVAIISLLAAIAIPNFIAVREQSQLKSIVTNLRIIEGAKDLWSLENKKGPGARPVPEDLSVFMKGNIFPPETIVGETYLINPVGISPTAKIPVKLGSYIAGDFVRLP